MIRIDTRHKVDAKPPYDDRTNPRFTESWAEGTSDDLKGWLWEHLIAVDNCTGLAIECGGVVREFILVGKHIETLKQRERE